MKKTRKNWVMKPDRTAVELAQKALGNINSHEADLQVKKQGE
ncbi:hypothetical protein [Halalkalibacter krulwichiae]|uniref:Uncharacterized protein n=1 Tax=Halalkalibacter krulwichiae TaxID=199441 RepID=A0A1X9MJR5_9BACI|nr:hypothetical protein [Halalkalibacter krulwichiae]ARK30842.1 hypothetical protein BkAM31D_13880 [Halalkalibacter krulwichiae]